MKWLILLLALWPVFFIQPPGPTPVPDTVTVGYSVRGMPIVAERFGDGPMPVLLTGGIHGGYEINTVVLMSELGAYFHEHPEAIAPNISLYIIPVANPDGLLRGRGFAGRFNKNGVDLNRNWGCGWLPEAYAGSAHVNPGPAPFSEPETQALRDFILELQPLAVVWYHSAADGIFPGACDGIDRGGSAWLAGRLSRATGYPTGVPFNLYHYDVSGTAPDWVDAQGIPSVDLELSSRKDTEFARNLAGVMALQCHFAQLAAPGWHVDNLYAFIEQHCEAEWLSDER
ncbi:MAG: hypothetical protein JXB47_21185 [Anaerolineae bacterium]|nr:hypothetical protein [Anaerolineae bacterium]